VYHVGFVIRNFKSNIQQQFLYSDIPTTKSYLKANFPPPPHRWTNCFLQAVTVGSNPAQWTIFSPVFVLHCEGSETLLLIDIPSDEIYRSSEHH